MRRSNFLLFFLGGRGVGGEKGVGVFGMWG